MKNLQILTNNHLGKSFWEQRTGLIDSILFNELDLNVFDQLIENQSNFILFDFYFSKIPMSQKLKMINKVMYSVEDVRRPLKLFILSPTFTDSELIYNQVGNKVIVSDNFSDTFFRILQNETKINQPKKSLLTSN